ncbi:cellulose binding domain-containing protein [Actinoplanes sp. NPDC023801]|uniref:cellulose binding domain-containing protein n=1 Tax=Actinoplanes sp. NPDC023801 TaxID=3154595 RepID=UPI0033D66A15
MRRRGRLTASGDHYRSTNLNWNGTIAPGATTGFGFNVVNGGLPLNGGPRHRRRGCALPPLVVRRRAAQLPDRQHRPDPNRRTARASTWARPTRTGPVTASPAASMPRTGSACSTTGSGRVSRRSTSTSKRARPVACCAATPSTPVTLY